MRVLSLPPPVLAEREQLLHPHVAASGREHGRGSGRGGREQAEDGRAEVAARVQAYQPISGGGEQRIKSNIWYCMNNRRQHSLEIVFVFILFKCPPQFVVQVFSFGVRA